MPPQYSSISSRTVMPAGARCTPGFATRPDTENERRPLRPFLPCPANHPAPRSRMSRTQYSVSMLCSSVGRPNSPNCATYGGRRRGMPQVDRRQRARRIAGERVELAREQRAARRVFVAQVDVDRIDADRPRADQHPFQEPVRVALEVVAILERPGLALVDVDGHQPRRRLAAD